MESVFSLYTRTLRRRKEKNTHICVHFSVKSLHRRGSPACPPVHHTCIACLYSSVPAAFIPSTFNSSGQSHYTQYQTPRSDSPLNLKIQQRQKPPPQKGSSCTTSPHMTEWIKRGAASTPHHSTNLFVVPARRLIEAWSSSPERLHRGVWKKSRHRSASAPSLCGRLPWHLYPEQIVPDRDEHGLR